MLARSIESFTRHAAYLALALLALGACSSESSTSAEDAPAPDEPIVKTEYGEVGGSLDDGIYAFKGIPYGASTAGENRFMPPQPPAPWDGVRDATEYGDRAPQAVPDADSMSDYGKLIRWNEHPGELSEDCLVLNVWTPGINDGGKRPVMVSFHGGGFTSGSGNGHGYVGDPLARFGDVVVVTVNHRLGVMGYLHLGDLAGPDFAKSGVAGMLDLVASLEWVRDNIEAFGGDPDTVMVWGQSGGGAKTSTLLAMPAAKGLFDRAAVQSGSSLRMRTRESATAASKKLFEELGLEATQIAELQQLPFEDLIAAQAKVAGGFAPVVDGEVLPRHPFDPDAPEVSKDVPMIIGWTLDDAALALSNFELAEEDLKGAVSRVTGDRTDKIVAAYQAAYPEANPFKIQARIMTDARFGRGALEQAARKAEQGGAPAYLYLWAWESPGMGGKFGAVHGVDVGLAFHNSAGEITGSGSPEGAKMADRLASAWVAFARSGDPNNPELPEWPPYDRESKPTMVFDTETRVENDPLGELRGFWEE